jgi:hypothetical protein
MTKPKLSVKWGNSNHEDLLFTDPALFNQKMSDWLVFYNTELAHLSPKPNLKKMPSLTNLPVSPIELNSYSRRIHSPAWIGQIHSIDIL